MLCTILTPACQLFSNPELFFELARNAIYVLCYLIFQPHLHTIVNKSMELALSAKEPYNYFLLLRALFRSIGGGSHDLLYQEFLPLLPSLLHGLCYK